MNLIELKSFVDQAIESAKEFGDDPSNILVSVQIDDAESETLWSDDIELTYDNDGQASGCVLHGWAAKYNKTKKDISSIEKEDICGYCGQPGADKMALWTGGGLYWPGEFIPESEMVHQQCENEETQRAHADLTRAQRESFLNSI